MSVLRECRRLAKVLEAGQIRVVFAESCTCGLVSATLGKVPGISAYHCGSAVTYRDQTKTGWLGISARSLRSPGPVSQQVARQMAVGVLGNTPEAQFAASVTGHLGPDVPPGLDGLVLVGIARRRHDGRVAAMGVFEHHLTSTTRAARQQEAAQLVVTRLREAIQDNGPKDES